ncbi:hypothetical protein THAOC_26437, partial [Thalassiosira oceanica]
CLTIFDGVAVVGRDEGRPLGADVVAPAVGLPLGADVPAPTETVGDEVCPVVGPEAGDIRSCRLPTPLDAAYDAAYCIATDPSALACTVVSLAEEADAATAISNLNLNIAISLAGHLREPLHRAKPGPPLILGARLLRRYQSSNYDQRSCRPSPSIRYISLGDSEAQEQSHKSAHESALWSITRFIIPPQHDTLCDP